MKHQRDQVAQRQHRNLFLSGLLASGLLLAVFAGCSRGDSASSASGGAGSDNVTASSSKTVGASGGGVVLPNLATLLVPPGSTGNNPITIEAVTSPAMDSLAPEATPGFEFLAGVPKFRVRIPQQPTELVELAIAIPNLSALVPATHTLAIAMATYESESDEEAPALHLSTIVGGKCEEDTAVCVTLMPEWFTQVSGATDVQVQLGVGRVKSGNQAVAMSWWGRLFAVGTATAADPRWHLWEVSNSVPSNGDIVVPDAQGNVVVGATVALVDNIPVDALNPVAPMLMTSDFGPRDPGQTAASNWHKGNDLRAASGQDLYPIFDGMVVALNEQGRSYRCNQGRTNEYQSDPEKNITIASGPSGELKTTYRHLSMLKLKEQDLGKTVSAIFPPPAVWPPSIALTGSTGSACSSPHLHVEMEFDDEFGGTGKIDPWPVLKNNMNRFVLDDLGDPVTRPPDGVIRDASNKDTYCWGCRDIFKIKWKLSIEGGAYRAPGKDATIPFIPQYIEWPAKASVVTLDQTQGTYNLGSSASLVSNGKYFVRLSICSGSLGSCRQVRQWNIRANPAIVAFSNPTYMVTKTAGQTAITLTRTGNLAEALTVTYLLSSTTAVQGTDYADASATPGMVRFEANQTTASIPMSIFNNPTNTTARFVTVSLGQITGNGIVGSLSTASLTITGSAVPLNVCEPDVPTYAPSGCELPRLVARNPYTPIPAGQVVPLSDIVTLSPGTCGDTVTYFQTSQTGFNWTLLIPEPYRSIWAGASFFTIMLKNLPPANEGSPDISLVGLQTTGPGRISMPVFFRADKYERNAVTTVFISRIKVANFTCTFQQEAATSGP